jgi:hypothetical protein
MRLHVAAVLKAMRMLSRRELVTRREDQNRQSDAFITGS